MNALRVGDVGERTGIEKRALLGDGFPLEIRRAKVRERVVAGVVVVGVAPHIAGNVENSIRAYRVGPRRRDVEGQDLGALIGRPQGSAGHRVGLDVPLKS